MGEQGQNAAGSYQGQGLGQGWTPVAGGGQDAAGSWTPAGGGRQGAAGPYQGQGQGQVGNPVAGGGQGAAGYCQGQEQGQGAARSYQGQGQGQGHGQWQSAAPQGGTGLFTGGINTFSQFSMEGGSGPRTGAGPQRQVLPASHVAGAWALFVIQYVSNP